MRREIAKVTTLICLTAAALLGEVAWAQPAGNQMPIRVGGSDATQPSQIAVVERGDHLWSISESHLDHLAGHSVPNAEISPYWRRVIEVNTPHLRSGNPDLIYPGEEITLPEVEPRD